MHTEEWIELKEFGEVKFVVGLFICFIYFDNFSKAGCRLFVHAH